MKLFHISDLHIGLKLMNHDLTEDQKYVHNQIIAYAKKEKPVKARSKRGVTNHGE